MNDPVPGGASGHPTLQSENAELRHRLSASESYTATTLARATRLSQIISVLGNAIELDQVVGRAATTVCELFSADLAVLMLGSDDEELTIAGHWGVSLRDVPAGAVAITGLNHLTQSSPIATGPVCKLGLPTWLDRYRGRHAAWVRLAIGHESLGLLLIVRRADMPFELSDNTELQAIATRLALAVENGLLHRQMRTQIDQLARLQAFTVDLAATLEPDAVAQRVADEVVREIDVQASAVYLDGAEPIATSGPQSPASSWHRMPIATAAGTVGQLVILRRPAPGSDAEERLAHLLGLAGLALEKALLYDRSREQARRDSLTGLLAHRTFQEGLQALVESGSPFTLILADIDDFKQVNDLYGHPVGDDALRGVAQELCAAVRAQDMVYRIGGEEFCVLLPALAGTGAAGIAERLRQAVEQIAVPLPVTVSVGVASFPEHADNRDELLARADAALYASKSAGKNRITVADSLRGETAPIVSSNRLNLRLLHDQDPATAVHSAHVANLAVAVARHLGVPADRLGILRRASMLHDIGKIGVPQAILRKPGALEPAEFAIVQTHCLIGAELLRRAGEAEAAQIVLEHHENVDGSGYPAGLRGDQIALDSRIVRVADAFVAMTFDRPYRAAMSPTDAERELQRCAGRQFDPDVVDALRAVLATGAATSDAAAAEATAADVAA